MIIVHHRVSFSFLHHRNIITVINHVGVLSELFLRQVFLKLVRNFRVRFGVHEIQNTHVQYFASSFLFRLFDLQFVLVAFKLLHFLLRAWQIHQKSLYALFEICGSSKTVLIRDFDFSNFHTFIEINIYFKFLHVTFFHCFNFNLIRTCCAHVKLNFHWSKTFFKIVEHFPFTWFLL